MAYFPAFIDLNNKKILIIGGGKIANEKLEHLLNFTSNIELIALNFTDEILLKIKQNSLNFIQNSYNKNIIFSYDIIIAAIDDINLQKEIYKDCKDNNILCNCVDLIECCDFIFPSYIKKGDLIIAISTQGKSPALARELRIFLEKIIPNQIEDFLQNLSNLRKSLPKGKERMQLLRQKAKEYVNSFKSP